MKLFSTISSLRRLDEVAYEGTAGVPTWMIILISGIAGAGLFLLFYFMRKKK